MSTQLMRNDLKKIRPEDRKFHPGLWLDRGCKEHYDDKPEFKAEHVGTLCKQQPSELYKGAWKRWQTVTSDENRFRRLSAELPRRLFLGNGAANALETGVFTSHTYGMPMIPGSSVKGCARAYAVAIGVPDEYRAVLFGEDEKQSGDSGRLPGAACLIWHDAWWNPKTEKAPFIREVITPHHQEYYAGKADATDFDSPIPTPHIAVQGSFYFVVEGDPAWAKLGIELLMRALEEVGIGGKRAAGYGQMKENPETRKERKECARRQMPPEERLRRDLGQLNEKKLAETFGRDINKTREDYDGLPDETLRRIALEIHEQTIASWKDEDRKKTNKGKAYHFMNEQA